MKKRVLSFVLAILMCVSLFPFAVLESNATSVTEATSTANNVFDTVAPGTYTTENPYGKGTRPFLMLEQNELLMYSSRNRLTDGASKAAEAELNNVRMFENLGYNNSTGYSTFATKNYKNWNDFASIYSYVQRVAFDPLGHGRNDHIAYIGIKKDPSSSLFCAFLFVVNAATGEQVGSAVRLSSMRWTVQAQMKYAEGSTDRYGDTWNFAAYYASNFLAITAGDYDGNGCDTIVVYVAGDSSGTVDLSYYRNRGAALYEYGCTAAGLTGCYARTKSYLQQYYIESESTAFASGSYADGSNKDGSSWGLPRNKLSCSLGTGDFNGDGCGGNDPEHDQCDLRNARGRESFGLVRNRILRRYGNCLCGSG